MDILSNLNLFNRQYKSFQNIVDLNHKLICARKAAQTAWFRHPGFFVCSALERDLFQIAEKITAIPPKESSFLEKEKKQILHVLTAAYPTGGHTRLVKQIIENRSHKKEIHSVIILNQEGAHPPWLEETALSSGGTFTVLPTTYSDIEKAIVLRNIAYDIADIIFLHDHPDDPIPSVSFGVHGGPPVVVINHADHVFWIGAGIADVVVNISSSGDFISTHRRNVRKSYRLPLPLDQKKKFVPSNKQDFGIADNTIVLLSIANGYKYVPRYQLNFPLIMADVLKHYDNVVLFTVGNPPLTREWHEGNRVTQDRMKTIGVVENISDYYSMADIFIESFPMPSYTSTLEAPLYGVPVFRAPVSPVSDLFLLDSYDGMNVPTKDVELYKNELHQWIANETLRVDCGVRQQKAIEEKHLNEGWNHYFDLLIEQLPLEHTVGFKDNSFRENVYLESEEVWARG